jgi:hypothetical protein
MNYIIACAGGFGREIFHALSLSLQQQNELANKNDTIVGFIDDNLQTLDNYGNRYPPVIDTIETYKPVKLFLLHPVYRKAVGKLPDY